MRSRNIKPGLFRNEDIGADEVDPLVMILFVGLWCLADREGLVEDRPKRIKADLFPYRNLTTDHVDKFLSTLADFGMIERYEVEGIRVIKVVNFEKHQSPHSTEKQSTLPKAVVQVQSYQHVSESTVNPPLSNGGYRSDSLIPDSLIPEKIRGSDEPPHSSGEQKKPQVWKQEIEEIFEFWKTTFSKNSNVKLTPERKRLIGARLNQGYTPEQIRNAILGCSLIPWNRGHNPNGTKYEDLDLICRDGAHVERFEDTYLQRQPQIVTADMPDNGETRLSMKKFYESIGVR